MGFQKERETFESYLKKMGKTDSETFSKYEDDSYRMDIIHFGWKIWQAAKADAVPEGFVVVSQKDLLELTIAINAVDLATHTESKTNEVREMWQQIALKLMALGISQEPAND